jgi:hypothetical protein
VLTFRNELMVDYDPEYVGKQMMAVVTFFSAFLSPNLRRALREPGVFRDESF